LCPLVISYSVWASLVVPFLPTRRSSDLFPVGIGVKITKPLVKPIKKSISSLVKSIKKDWNGLTKWLGKIFNPIAKNWQKSWKKRSEEHTSELQSRFDLVCRLLLEKKKHV